MLVRPGARPGETQRRRVDAQRVHQVEDPLLVVELGVGHGRVLESVTQRLVVQLDALSRAGVIGLDVPVVDEAREVLVVELSHEITPGSDVDGTRFR